MSSATKSGYSDASTDLTTKIQGQLTFLMGAYDRLSTDAAIKDKRFNSLASKVESMDTKMDSKLSAMESKLDAKLDSVLKALGKQPVIDRSPIQTPLRDPVFASSQSQVRTSHFERVREHSSLGFREDNLNLGKRENMLKKSEMPLCVGTRVSEWLVDVEYFYELGRYDEEARLDLVPLCLKGALKKWFAWVMRRGGFQSWKEFK